MTGSVIVAVATMPVVVACTAEQFAPRPAACCSSWARPPAVPTRRSAGRGGRGEVAGWDGGDEGDTDGVALDNGPEGLTEVVRSG